MNDWFKKPKATSTSTPQISYGNGVLPANSGRTRRELVDFLKAFDCEMTDDRAAAALGQLVDDGHFVTTKRNGEVYYHPTQSGSALSRFTFEKHLGPVTNLSEDT